MLMDGKICLITGATSGIGKEMAIGLAKLGATIFFASRSKERGDKARQEIIVRSGNEKVEFGMCDLASFVSICKFVDEFNKRYEKLHVLVNNAGLWNMKMMETADGIEETWQVNYLSMFLMTNLLVDKLKSSAPSRIVNTASQAHKDGTIDFDDIEMRRSYGGFRAYAQSKLAIVIFTKELARRLKGTGVTANCFHPGFVYTGLYRNLNYVLRGIIKLITISPERGARTGIFLASSSEVEGISGEYFIKDRIASASMEANDRSVAGRLWEVSERYAERAPCYRK